MKTGWGKCSTIRETFKESSRWLEWRINWIVMRVYVGRPYVDAEVSGVINKLNTK